MIAKFGFSTDCDSDDDDDDGDDTQVVQLFEKSPTKLYCPFFQYFQQAFYKLLIMTRNFQSKFTPVTEGLLEVNFFLLTDLLLKKSQFLDSYPNYNCDGYRESHAKHFTVFMDSKATIMQVTAPSEHVHVSCIS